MTVLFGGNSGDPGFFNETWEYDGNAWTQRLVAGPPGRSNFKMVYDEERHVTVLFGGTNSGAGTGTGVLGDTWEWDGTTWSQRATTGPAAREYFGMVYDSARKVTMLAGGFTKAVDGEMWEWDGRVWTKREAPGLTPRYLHAMAYDKIRHVAVLFSGHGPEEFGTAELWELAAPDPNAEKLDAPRVWSRRLGQ